MVSNDPVSTAMSSITRLASDLGEKATFSATQELIGECIASDQWVRRQAGYTLLGLIAPACKEGLKKNMTDAMMTASRGI
jgi:hypothetical protein